MIDSVGPKPIDSAVIATQTNLGNLRDRRDWLVRKFDAQKARIKTVTNIASGEWYVEWPDLSHTPEAPTVANQIELSISHWSAIGGSMMPSIKVPMNKTADRRKEKAAARKRERRVRELWESSNASEIAALLWADYAGTGSAVAGAWCDFETKDPADRNPYLVRYDPRHTYILKDNRGNVTEMLVARKISKQEIATMYPEWSYLFTRSRDEDVEEWYWYEMDRVRYMIVDVSKDGRTSNRNLILVDKEWKLGFIPVWEATKPSFDGERRGVFDQSVHILRTMQRLMLLTIMSTEEHAFPTVVSYDAINPQDFGPGGHVQLRSSEGKVDRVGPTAHFDVKDLIGRLGEEAAKGAVYPQQLTGDPGASIVSSRGIKASMGALDARLALAHAQFEVLFGKVSGFLLAFDETFCDGEKTIVGDLRDTSDAETYIPSKDVDGSWVVKCTYGLGAGSDPANVEVRLNMHLANGLISKETAREQLPFLKDPDAEPVLQLREQMQESLVVGVLARAQEGDPSLAAEALKLLKSDELNIDEVIEKLVDVIMAPPAQGQGGDPALQVAQGAESLARGGIPGNAEQAPPAAGMGLPPLAQILGQDSRQVI